MMEVSFFLLLDLICAGHTAKFNPGVLGTGHPLKTDRPENFATATTQDLGYVVIHSSSIVTDHACFGRVAFNLFWGCFRAELHTSPQTLLLRDKDKLTR